MSAIAADIFRREIRASLEGAEEHRRSTGRPFCTLTYAQSVDGCIALRPAQKMGLSGRESLVLTHHLRAWHEAILIGIRTVLVDNPTLNVYLVSGPDPRPVVLDSRLRTPLNSNVLNHGARRPLIATTRAAKVDHQHHLEDRGAHILHCPANDRGWVGLEPMLEEMGRMGINSLMVEGGARVLTSFMTARLVDQVVITIAPMILGGVHAFRKMGDDPALLPRLSRVRYTNLGSDLIVWGFPAWGEK